MKSKATTTVKLPTSDERRVTPNFITDIIDADLKKGVVDRVVTRFPPEPNGYLHVGHAKAICLSFGVAQDYGGITYLRFDDTNPVTEDPEYVQAIKEDVRWLGFDWEDVRHASDYFGRLYDMAVRLIEMGDAYVDTASEEEIRTMRGTVTEPGVESPGRRHSVAENLDLFTRMRMGEFGPGEAVLRARIDMASPNMKMRDPILYRVVDAEHYRTGSEWPIYPMYDYAHPLSDAIEGVTHSLCTLEFENNRDVYDWLVERLVDGVRPHQYEFARLALDHTVVSKRKLLRLVREGVVSGWDDPRMPTISALRRKGVTPEAIREFTNRVGVAKANSRTDLALLDSAVRDDLNQRAPRVMAVLEPLRVALTNVAEDELVELDAPYWPDDVPNEGSRTVPLTRNIAIERADFEVEPPKGFKRLAPGRAVRLRHAFVIHCDDFETDDSGAITQVNCRVYKDSLGSNPEGVKVWSALHWVSESAGLPFTARLYEPLFTEKNPDAADGDLMDHLNPTALREHRGLVEPSVADDEPDTRYQFERLGYFWRDPVDGRGPLDATAHTPPNLVFNRIVGLKDSWAKQRSPAMSEAAARGQGAGERTAAAKSSESSGGGSGGPGVELTPEQRAVAARLVAEAELAEGDAQVLARRPALLEFFEGTVAAGAPARAAANWVVNDVAGAASQAGFALTPAALASLIELLGSGTITQRVAKELMPELIAGAQPRALIAERGLERMSEQAIREAVATVVAQHPEEAGAYRAGKLGLKGFFVGQVMRITEGRAEPKLVQRLIDEELAG